MPRYLVKISYERFETDFSQISFHHAYPGDAEVLRSVIEEIEVEAENQTAAEEEIKQRMADVAVLSVRNADIP